MKKITLLIMLILTTTLSLFAKYKVMERCAINGCEGGYDNVCKTLRNYSITLPNGEPTNVTGYALECENPGCENCPTKGSLLSPVLPNDFDVVQINSIDELMSFAKNEISQNRLTGSFSIKVQVEGESYQRIYSVEWVAEDITSLTSKITIYRDNL
jgi:hypothetical protein